MITRDHGRRRIKSNMDDHARPVKPYAVVRPPWATGRRSGQTDIGAALLGRVPLRAGVVGRGFRRSDAGGAVIGHLVGSAGGRDEFWQMPVLHIVVGGLDVLAAPA